MSVDAAIAWPPAAPLQVARGRVYRPGDADDVLACWHAETDTLPWVQEIKNDDGHVVDPDHVEVFLPVGVFSAFGEIARVTVTVRVDGGDPTSYRTDDGQGIDVVRPEFVFGPLQKYRGHEPWRLLDARHHRVDLDARALEDVSRKTYFVLKLTVARDAELDYVVSANTPMLSPPIIDPGLVATSAFTLRASAPAFGPDSLVAVHPAPGDLPRNTDGLDRWVLLKSEERGFLHLRLDVLSTIMDNRGARPPIRMQAGDVVVDLGDARDQRGPEERVRLPLLDRESDCVLLTVPADAVPARTVDVRSGGGGQEPEHIRLDVKPLRRVRFAIVNFAIQGHNDLFAEPRGPYEPPRTYMQLTMRDERGVWSSRPGSTEDGEPDGYALTLGAHRHYKIPAMWAFNAGVLTMIAHDCPKDLRQIRKDIKKGVLVPINPGFGAHRPPFYATETNIEELHRGIDVVSAFLPEAPPAGLSVYHPDQRLYEARKTEVTSYTEENGLVRYLVLDRSGLCFGQGDPPDTGPSRGPTQTKFFKDAGLAADRVHEDPFTKLRILPIEDVARENFMPGEDDDVERGKAGYAFRSLLFAELSELTAEEDAPQVVVYGDDADKASGCGWFDGDYAGRPLHFNEKYQAALCWLSRHPWVEVVTVTDLDDEEPTSLGKALWSGSCPSVDPSAATATDLYGNVMHFDTWYEKWASWRSPWLGAPLGQMSKSIEDDLVGAGGNADLDEELVGLAWMTFLGLNHEMYWNKEALEGALVDKRLGVLSPEDFVIAASLHLGLTRLYLCAARWGKLAPTLGPETLVSQGPLVDDLRNSGLGGGDGLHWEGDLLPNDLLYNDRVLAVLDRNGGRAIAVFARTDDGRAICVSGTPKTFQWTQPDPERPVDAWLTCDGNVLENSVLTPNHLYVASDLRESAPRVGWHHEDRARQVSPQRWLYADTFDEYTASLNPSAGAVTYGYAAPSGPQPVGTVGTDLFENACKQDHDARTGQGGDRVIWHRDDLDFRKTIRLDGPRIRVAYERAPAGHRVGNEFSVDLHTAMTGCGFQARSVGSQARRVTLTGARGGGVRIAPRRGCRLSAASLIGDADEAQARGLSVDFLRLHRVLTDAVEIECRDGGSFEYTIDIAG
jgi:hypothetical protein